jgi:hypothetical protein
MLVRRGDFGRQVQKVQRALNFHADSPTQRLVVDGRFGRLTEGRVKEFQITNDLAPDGNPDGIVGPRTHAVLFDLARGTIAIRLRRLRGAGTAVRSSSVRPGSALGFGPSAVPPAAPTFGGGTGDRTGPRVQIIDWGTAVTISPLSDEKVIETDVTFAIKHGEDDDDVVEKFELEGKSGQSETADWEFSATLKTPIHKLPESTRFEGSLFLTNGLDLNKASVSSGVGTSFGLKVFNDKLKLLIQGEVKLQYEPLGGSLELDKSASARIELKF